MLHSSSGTSIRDRYQSPFPAGTPAGILFLHQSGWSSSYVKIETYEKTLWFKLRWFKPPETRDRLPDELMRFGRALYFIVSDPDYPNRQTASELRGRMVQLERSWRMLHEPMPEADGEALLREVLPE